MVCISCIVIPLVLWIFHKFIQPFFLRFWNPSQAVTQNHDGPPKGITEDNKEYSYIQQKAKENPVMLFSKTTCSYSKMATNLLDKIEVDYCVDMIQDREDCGALQDMFLKMTGERTVPRVFIGGKCVGGSSDIWTLHNKGELVPMLEKSGANFRNKKTD